MASAHGALGLLDWLRDLINTTKAFACCYNAVSSRHTPRHEEHGRPRTATTQRQPRKHGSALQCALCAPHGACNGVHTSNTLLCGLVQPSRPHHGVVPSMRRGSKTRLFCTFWCDFDPTSNGCQRPPWCRRMALMGSLIGYET